MNGTRPWVLRGIAAFVGRPETVLSATFAALIVIGTLLLWSPASQAAAPIGLLDALFTATSAVCVTGLITVDTGTAYSLFGQVVILLLIQFGGLGIATFAALAGQVLGLRMSFRSQAMLADTFFQGDAATRMRRDLMRIVALTLVFEALGALLLYGHFVRNPGGRAPGFSAVFHAVSAFCNAGFSIYPDNFVSHRFSPAAIFTIMALIVAGGLGHAVVLESVRRTKAALLRRPQTPLLWSLHSRVVLYVSAGLIAGGAVALLAFGLTDGERTWGEKAMNALFQSVTARTAGYNTIDIGRLPTASLLVLIGLMFIGGSPASCAGGIKTTSAAAAAAELASRLTGRGDVVLLGRRLSADVLNKATMIIGLAVLWNGVGCLLLSVTEMHRPGVRLEDLIFEQVSAFATVGLSTGITAGLSTAGKLWLIATMFIGRVGPLTAAIAFAPRDRAAPIRYPEERLMVG